MRGPRPHSLTDAALRPSILVITGPTASGKSELALGLAEALGGEIVSADALQVYRGLDIGTSKPSREERARVPHHLVDVAEPGEAYHAGRFRAEADRAIRQIRARGRVPLVCGGTALYLKTLLGGLAEGPPRDPAVRGELEAAWAAGEGGLLYAELATADPELAARLHPNDRSRIVRGLEVWRVRGVRLSALQAAHGFAERTYDALCLGVERPRAELYRRIDERVVRMMAQGWEAEVRGLLTAGVSPDSPALQAIGYREITRYLRQGGEREAVAASIQRATRNLAKRQMTWFRRMELEWVRPGEVAEVRDRARNFLLTGSTPL
ncbi:MAG: tRNA (adenosine(37)-N6)-dimethylallyltransferase MiaA [Deferrisomatales bacterium]